MHILSITLLLFVSILFVGCGEQPPEKTSFKKVVPRYSALSDNYAKTKDSSTSKKKPTRRTSSTSRRSSSTSSNSGGITDTISAVSDYGTGTTALTIKKKQTEKLESITKSYNEKR
jgi:hypothetical protein